ncbi:hypothetical protein AOXY_G28566 [Acipenser oxyrinchus oxyrinchus]|uniref:Endonuclease domain-containing 1 protein-like n=1 Tax=Acipenser oxyrinchus oxyrinchus TaxID=40147 RepID=A0AAD8CPK6_ACIOX|nr:hypothetical protein AOXY_G28566 [Acipenser oxyrinchus oxyrinchus]
MAKSFLCLAILVSLLGVGLASVLYDNQVFNNNNCGRFLYKMFEPKGLYHVKSSIKRICQCYQGADYFATMYNKNSFIPLYSAYVYGHQPPGAQGTQICGKGTGAVHTCSRERWCIEPEVRNQIPTFYCCYNYRAVFSGSQAVDDDYKGKNSQSYNRGHLNPQGHHEGNAAEATFTLTNSVPQVVELNTKWANQYEDNIQNEINTATGTRPCTSAYVLTGVLASNNNNNMNNRVNIPSHIWSAFCCVNNGVPTGSKAFLLGNNPNDQNQNVKSMTLQRLESYLKGIINKTTAVTLFHNNCKIPSNDGARAGRGNG